MAFDTQHPRFSPELEHLIFKRLARHSVADATNLLTVAKRVKEWVEPTLYRVVVLDDDTPWPPLKCFQDPSDRRILPFFENHGHHVKHLNIGSCPRLKDDVLVKYISSCPNVVDLAIWGHNFSYSVLSECVKLKLQRASTDFSDFDCIDWEGTGQEKEKRPYAKTGDLIDVSLWQESLTHLEIALESPDWEEWSCMFKGLKNLTHVSLTGSLEDADEIRKGVPEICKNLKVLAFVEPMSRYFDELEDYPEEDGPQDERPLYNGKPTGSSEDGREAPTGREEKLDQEMTARTCHGLPLYAEEDNEHKYLLMFAEFTKDWLKYALGMEDMWAIADMGVLRQETLLKKKKTAKALQMQRLQQAKQVQKLPQAQPSQKAQPAKQPAQKNQKAQPAQKKQNVMEQGTQQNQQPQGKKKKKKSKKNRKAQQGQGAQDPQQTESVEQK